MRNIAIAVCVLLAACETGPRMTVADRAALDCDPVGARRSPAWTECYQRTLAARLDQEARIEQARALRPPRQPMPLYQPPQRVNVYGYGNPFYMPIH